MGEPLNLLDKYMQKFFDSLYLQDTCIAWTFAYCYGVNCGAKLSFLVQ